MKHGSDYLCKTAPAPPHSHNRVPQDPRPRYADAHLGAVGVLRPRGAARSRRLAQVTAGDQHHQRVARGRCCRRVAARGHVDVEGGLVGQLEFCEDFVERTFEVLLHAYVGLCPSLSLSTASPSRIRFSFPLILTLPKLNCCHNCMKTSARTDRPARGTCCASPTASTGCPAPNKT